MIPPRSLFLCRGSLREHRVRKQPHRHATLLDDFIKTPANYPSLGEDENNKSGKSCDSC